MMDKKERLWFLFQFLHEVEKEMSREEEKQVMIEKAINLRLMCDYVVSCSYYDVVLIICMLYDYIRTLDEISSEDIQYQMYYRERFMKIANRLSQQIGYDYDEALEKCKKKLTKKEQLDDVGEEALTLSNRRSGKVRRRLEQ